MSKIRILVDTHVFILALLHDPKYVEFLSIFIKEDFVLVTCEELRKEYVRQMTNRYFPAYFLRYFLDVYEREGKHISGYPTKDPKLKIKNRKDQAHVNCAEGNDVKIIITEDEDFKQVRERQTEIPQIVTWNDFKDSRKRELIVLDHQQGNMK